VDPIGLLRAAPGATALLFDVDGTLAPIVDRPEDATVPEETRVELRRLAERYALVACVTGRAPDVARRILGVDGLEIVGEHGLALDPAAEAWAERIHAFADAAGWPAERKRLTVAFHWRTHPEAEPVVRRIGAEAEQAGFAVRWGRKVIDVMPPIDANKGTAVRALLARHREVRQALFAGDDTTDLDAFAGLREAPLELAVCVGVVTAESPAALRERADLVVDGPDAVRELLASL
jgi:trehalose-phosphatase